MKKKWNISMLAILAASTGWAQTSSTDAVMGSTVAPPVALAPAPILSSTVVSGEQKISINVKDTDMVVVLTLLSEQSDRNIVIGPNVGTDALLTMNLKEISLNDALDVILKPHGYGYRNVGDTIVVDKIDNLNNLSAVEALDVRVFKLKYLDANDVIEAIGGLISSRGRIKALSVAQLAGWEFNDSSDDTSVAKAERTSTSNQTKAGSKTLIVQDIPSAIMQIESIINKIDVMPGQVEIRAYFVEVNSQSLIDTGFDWQLMLTGDTWNTGSLDSDGALSAASSGTMMGNVAPIGWPTDTDISATETYDSGLAFGLVGSGSNFDIDMMLRAVEEDGDINILSAPRILAQDNQEASIVVGTKTPIINTESDGDSGSITTSLDYFERIGIQLNVVATICDNGMINMVVHPSVTEQSGSVSATLVGGSDTALTAYPVIETREAETRLTVHDGDTIAIGGLMKNKTTISESKVPLLGDIPWLGKLFRRDTSSDSKVELVILLSATVRNDLSSVGPDMDLRVDQSTDKLLKTWAVEPVSSVEEAIDAIPEVVVVDEIDADSAAVEIDADAIVE
jgi:type IV pilus assembly protein PilQ